MARRVSVALEAVLGEAGDWGRYQTRQLLALLLPIMFAGAFYSQFVFNAADLNYRCLVPECESVSSAQWTAGSWAQWALVPGSRCERWAVVTPPQPDAPRCHADTFTKNTQRCHAWLYQTQHTIVATFDLACQDWKRALVGTTHGVGVLCALIYVGALSDRVGRRPVLAGSLVAAGVVGLARSCVTSYPAYLALEFTEPLFGAGVYTATYVLIVEFVGIKKRVLCGGLVSLAYALGQATLALVAWAVPYWRHLTRILYMPALLFILYFFVVDESFRWLSIEGKSERAIKVLRNIAKVNRKTLTDATVAKLIEDCRGLEQERRSETQSTLMQIVRSGVLMRRLVVLWFVWATSTLVYYGLSVNAVSLAGNMYVNYILVSLVEAPGYLLSVLTLDRWGRKPSIMAAYFVCGLALLALPFVPTERWWGGGVQVSLALAGKLSVSSAFNGLYVWSSEVFPTSARARALAACSLVARFGQIFATLTPLLMGKHMWIMFVLFCGMSWSAAALLTLLPETRHAPLPDSVAAAERQGGRAERGARNPAAPPPPPPTPLPPDIKP